MGITPYIDEDWPDAETQLRPRRACSDADAQWTALDDPAARLSIDWSSRNVRYA